MLNDSVVCESLLGVLEDDLGRLDQEAPISLRGIYTEVQTEVRLVMLIGSMADELAHCGNPLPKEAHFVCLAMPPAGRQTPGTQ